MKHTFENTYVNVLDLERMAKDFGQEIGEEVKVPNFGGLILKPMVGLLDTEIVLRPLGNEAVFKIDIYEADKPLTDGRSGFSVAMMPKWGIKMTVEELTTYVKETMPISEYVKDRRGYNSRLERNEAAVENWLNGK